jgi:putative protein-disulfide isomerase
MSAETTSEQGEALQITYVGDPMCSWCYGFEPEIKALREAWSDQAEFHLLVGGLRRDQSPIDQRMRSFLEHHWEEVSERTGQPFNFDILDTDLVYDTEPACRATVTAAHLADGDPEEAAFLYFSRAQRAFYEANRNPGERDTWVDLAAELGYDGDRFLAHFDGDELKQKTIDQFARSREMGVTGYPSLIAERGTKRRYITLGYAEFSDLDERLQQFVAAT